MAGQKERAASPPSPKGPPCFSTARRPSPSTATAVAATTPPRARVCSDAIGAQPGAAAHVAPPLPPHVASGLPQNTTSAGSASSRDRLGGAPPASPLPPRGWAPDGTSRVCRRSSPLACPESSTVVLLLRRYDPRAVTGEAVPAVHGWVRVRRQHGLGPPSDMAHGDMAACVQGRAWQPSAVLCWSARPTCLVLRHNAAVQRQQVQAAGIVAHRQQATGHLRLPPGGRQEVQRSGGPPQLHNCQRLSVVVPCGYAPVEGSDGGHGSRPIAACEQGAERAKLSTPRRWRRRRKWRPVQHGCRQSVASSVHPHPCRHSWQGLQGQQGPGAGCRRAQRRPCRPCGPRRWSKACAA